MRDVKRVLLAIGVLTSCSDGPSLQNDYFNQASASLSDAPFGLPFAERPKSWSINGSEPCAHWTDCEYVSQSGVAHSFHDGRLVIKYLKVANAAEQISALGIGRARNKQEVLDAVAAFVGRRTFECIGIERDECFADLGQVGMIKFYFNAEDELTGIRIDKWPTK